MLQLEKSYNCEGKIIEINMRNINRCPKGKLLGGPGLQGQQANLVLPTNIFKTPH